MFKKRLCRSGAGLFFLLAVMLLLFAATGCGSSDFATVQGSVSYHEKPLANGRIGFYPEKGRPAFSEIREGKFSLSTHKPGDGARVGSYRVTVCCDIPKDPKDAFSDRISLIPTKYQKAETSGLTADVKKGANDFQFELKD